MKPEISVLLPVHNAERFLKHAIESILDQSFRDFELFLINDGSTDGSGEILEYYKKSDRRIRIINNPDNLGLSRSLNIGIAQSNGVYIARMDADDISLPDRFAVQVDFLNTYPEIGVLGSLYREIDRDGNLISAESLFPTVPEFVKWCFFFYNPIVHPAVMMRREPITAVGGYDPSIERSQDKDLWVRLFWATQFNNVPQALIYLRKHDANVSISGYSKGLAHNAIILSQLESQLVGYPVLPDCALNLYRNVCPTEESTCTAINVIADLYFAYIKLFSPSNDARVLIAKDVQQRVGPFLYSLPVDTRESMMRTRPELIRILSLTI